MFRPLLFWCRALRVKLQSSAGNWLELFPFSLVFWMWYTKIGWELQIEAIIFLKKSLLLYFHLRFVLDFCCNFFGERITLHSSAHIISSLSHNCCCVCTENQKSTLPVFPFLICTPFLTSVLSTLAFQRNPLFFERKATMERSTFISPCKCRNGCDKYDLLRH